MALQGNLRTMPLAELLQWLGTSRKTGVLRLERSKVVKFIVLREGTIAACSSDDPPELLGHYLVGQGKITEDVLRQGLQKQAATKEHLGKILVEMQAVSLADLKRLLASKAEETIFSLFDWEDGEFSFDEAGDAPQHVFPLDLRVEDVLLRGLRRYDESRRIRSVFNDPGIVLRRTDREPPAEVFKNRTARSIFEAVTGDRTVAEILLHAHGSEFLVTKFLFELFRAGIVEIAEVRAVAADPGAPVPSAAADLPDAAVSEAPASEETAEPGPSRGAEAVVPEPAAPTISPEAELEAARALMGRGEYEGACDILNVLYKNRPADESLRRLLAEAEAAFVEKAYRHYFPAGKVPGVKRPIESLTGEDLSPLEFFLLSRMNGTWDIRSIVQITPTREFDTLRTLKRLRERGIVEIRDPD